MSAGLGTGWTASGALANTGLTAKVGTEGSPHPSRVSSCAASCAQALPTSMNTSPHACVMTLTTLVMAAS
jgi:hypothetical protein